MNVTGRDRGHDHLLSLPPPGHDGVSGSSRNAEGQQQAQYTDRTDQQPPRTRDQEEENEPSHNGHARGLSLLQRDPQQYGNRSGATDSQYPAAGDHHRLHDE